MSEPRWWRPPHAAAAAALLLACPQLVAPLAPRAPKQASLEQPLPQLPPPPPPAAAAPGAHARRWGAESGENLREPTLQTLWEHPVEAHGFWAPIEGPPEPRPDFQAAEAQAWSTVIYAHKWGWHRRAVPGAWRRQLRGRLLLGSAERADWYILAVVLQVLLAIDVVVLQHLPETERTNLVLLLFWLLVAVALGVEVWFRLGPQAGAAWTTGYAMELVFSFDNVFVFHVIFCALEVPRRLMAKALFVGLLGSIAIRLLFFLGLASILDSLKVVPYALGLWLIYCGARQVTIREDESMDVTRTPAVRALRGVLGDRLGEFYDEEGEAMLMVSKGKVCMTLLGVAVLCLLAADFFLALDVVLAKEEELPNAYLNFSSSAMAMFAVRALFFVARDVFCRFGAMKYGVGLVLIFVGAEMLLAQAVYVSAVLSCLIITFITTGCVVVSSLRDLTVKAAP